MQYYKSKIIHLENTTKRFRGNEAMVVYSYGELNGTEYLGVITEYSPEDVMSLQPSECEVENISYEQLREIAINSAIARGIDEMTEKNIREKPYLYGADWVKLTLSEELKLMKLDVADPRRVAMQEHITACVNEGRAMKINMGIM